MERAVCQRKVEFTVVVGCCCKGDWWENTTAALFLVSHERGILTQTLQSMIYLGRRERELLLE